MKEILIYIATMMAVVLVIWVGGKYFAKAVSDYETITPRDGIECVVVSRMFNTSVDCYEVSK